MIETTLPQWKTKRRLDKTIKVVDCSSERQPQIFGTWSHSINNVTISKKSEFAVFGGN
tara:strand:+ start:1808 stop:1981 length:174 start_codon:yes stop_codon:yes gene_type:complete